MTNFKVGDTVKITGNTSCSVNIVGDIGIVHECGYGGQHRVNVEGRSQGGNWSSAHDMELVTMPDVPIGYVGLPKDMNLKDGDEIKGVSSGYTYVLTGGKIWGVHIGAFCMDYELISRASEWVLTDTPNYDTHDIATHNGVAVAARKKAPVVKTIGVRMYIGNSLSATWGTAQETDGAIDWSTLTVDWSKTYAYI
jgi:hypothetical protein